MSGSSNYPHLANFSLFLEYTKNNHLYELFLPPLGALIIIFLQKFILKFVIQPIGIFLGLQKIQTKKAIFDPDLEAAYILSLSKRLDKSENEILTWFETRKTQDRPSVLNRFSESLWKCSFVTIQMLVCVYIIWDKPWVWVVEDYWEDYFKLTVPSSDVWWFCLVYFSHVCAAIINLRTESRKKDFPIMVIHHVAVLEMTIVFWISNTLKIILITALVTHIPDMFLQGAKTVKYLGYEKWALSGFLMFAFSWVVSRLVLYPWMIVRLLLDVPEVWTTPVGYYYWYFAVCPVSITVVLNLIWTYFIVKIAARFFVRGVLQDSRSDNDD